MFEWERAASVGSAGVSAMPKSNYLQQDYKQSNAIAVLKAFVQWSEATECTQCMWDASIPSLSRHNESVRISRSVPILIFN